MVRKQLLRRCLGIRAEIYAWSINAITRISAHFGLRTTACKPGFSHLKSGLAYHPYCIVYFILLLMNSIPPYMTFPTAFILNVPLSSGFVMILKFYTNNRKYFILASLGAALCRADVDVDRCRSVDMISRHKPRVASPASPLTVIISQTVLRCHKPRVASPASPLTVIISQPVLRCHKPRVASASSPIAVTSQTVLQCCPTSRFARLPMTMKIHRTVVSDLTRYVLSQQRNAIRF